MHFQTVYCPEMLSGNRGKKRKGKTRSFLFSILLKLKKYYSGEAFFKA